MTKPTKSQVFETIFDGRTSIIPMMDVQHIERHSYGNGKYKGLKVIMKSTRWNYEHDDWDNICYLSYDENGKGEAADFMSAWCMFKHELESTQIEMINPETK